MYTRTKPVADPGFEKGGGRPGFAPKIVFVNIIQLRGLFKVFGENQGGSTDKTKNTCPKCAFVRFKYKLVSRYVERKQ